MTCEVDLRLGDCRDVMRELADDSVDAVVTDPPYELGFMGKSWDAAGVSFRPETWAECLRVLKPGGHLLAFGGTRTVHRIAVAIEDAGFEIRDMIVWMYGSGFPKSLDVSKAIDKAAGAERERVGDSPYAARRTSGDFGLVNDDGWIPNDQGITVSATEDAKRWEGWGTALKPAFEPITVARKPLIGTVAANVLAHGTGAINVDACRVGFASVEDEAESKEKNRHGDFGTEQGGNEVYGDYSMLAPRENYDPPGRWPANVVLGHTIDCVLVGEGKCSPDCPVRLVDEQTANLGPSQGTAGGRAVGGSTDVYGRGWAGAYERGEQLGYGDIGGASRFFYCAKTSRAERNAGLDATFEERDLRWSAGDQSPGTFQGEGTDRSARNHHPTVKPIELMRWLLRLVTPPDGVVLDPFLGSGSTGCAAILEPTVGRFVGVERETDYLAISRARIAFWQEHGEGALEVVRMRSQSEERHREITDAGQLDLFGAS